MMTGTRLRILLFLALAIPAFGDWRICNRTPQVVLASIVFDAGQGYVSTGWYKIGACGGCATVYHGMPKLRDVFFHAESLDRMMKWGDDYSFCVASEKFSFSGPTVLHCARPRSADVRMEDFHLEKLTGNEFTTNLTGKDPSGKVCIN